jgi:hypothetical protein
MNLKRGIKVGNIQGKYFKEFLICFSGSIAKNANGAKDAKEGAHMLICQLIVGIDWHISRLAD